MIKYFDIFAGIGGFRSGLEKSRLNSRSGKGFECVGYCRINTSA